MSIQGAPLETATFAEHWITRFPALARMGALGSK
jgi:hypothetical protein